MARLKPFASLLIANRGEIAVRIARTCRKLGVRSIAVYSDADARALHVRVCDEAVGIGGVSPRDSYLRGDRIIEAARLARAQAVHPGYGFLSENAAFAQDCRDAGLVFVGPPPEAMRTVGDKIAAKRTAKEAGIPIVEGYGDRDQSDGTLAREARRIAFPLLVKAAAGGGGRGMRLVRGPEDLAQAIEGARREAQAAFGDPTVFLERYVERPRHIEIQVLADKRGNVATYPERECSIQRRFQKIVEESPSSAVAQDLRERLQGAAAVLTRSVGYQNAGTVEFLVDERGDFYFLEMNARLQVEHPVTEMVTGVDLVEEQLYVAAGETIEGDAPTANGHAIEARIYAEDTESGFLPSTGLVTTFAPPSFAGVRNDVAIESGSDVVAAYDSMIAKLIVHAADRKACVAALARALDDYVIGGVASNVGFLGGLVALDDFVQARTQTDFLDRHQVELVDQRPRKPVALVAIAAAGALPALAPASHADRDDAWVSLGGWRHSMSPRADRFAEPDIAVTTAWEYGEGDFLGTTSAAVGSAGGERQVAPSESARVRRLGGGAFELLTAQGSSKFAAWRTPTGVAVSFAGDVTRFALLEAPSAQETQGQRHGAGGATGSVQAPMSGTIVKVAVRAGDAVERFAVLAVMEAMKMEHSIVAPYQGVVQRVDVQPGQTVSAGERLVVLAEN